LVWKDEVPVKHPTFDEPETFVGKAYFIFYDKQLCAQLLLDVDRFSSGPNAAKCFITRVLSFSGKIESTVRVRQWFNERTFF